MGIGGFFSLIWPVYYIILLFTISAGSYSRELTIAHRILTIFVSIFLFCNHYRHNKTRYWFFVLGIFFCAYSVRIYQNSSDGLLQQRGAAEYLQYLWGVTFIPALGAFSLGNAGRSRAQGVFIVLVPCAIFSVASYFFYKDFISLSGNGLGLRSRGRDEMTISPLALGYLGSGTVLIGLWGAINVKNNARKFLCLPMGASGLMPIIIGASRGALIGMMIAAFVYLGAILRDRQQSTSTIPKTILLLVVFGSAILVLFATENAAATRLMSISDDYEAGKSSMARTELYNEALTIFFDSPILGRQIELSSGMYPHNVFLESVMSCGLFGFIYIAVILKAGLCALKTITNREFGWISLLFILFFTFNMVSGSIWGADLLTISAMFLIGLSGKSIPKVPTSLYK